MFILDIKWWLQKLHFFPVNIGVVYADVTIKCLDKKIKKMFIIFSVDLWSNFDYLNL